MERPTDNNQEFQTASSEDEVVRKKKQQNDASRERQRESLLKVPPVLPGIFAVNKPPVIGAKTRKLPLSRW